MATEVTVDLKTASTAGRDLSRPECILATRAGYLYVSHRPEGLLEIAPDGTQTLLSKGTPGGLIPNGFAILPDGTFAIGNLGPEGGVWTLGRNGQLAPYLMEVEGQHLSSANFVLCDHDGTLWITNSTRQSPRDKALNVGVADGFIVRADGRGPRIVADGIAFSNEIRVGPGRRHVYVVETTGRCIRRFPLLPAGDLGPGDVFIQFGAGDFPDGAVFDAEDHLWVTSVFSNRLYRVDPSGRAKLLFEDANKRALEIAEKAREAGILSREHLEPAEGLMFRNLTSVTFGGADLRTVYLGSIGGRSLVTFRSPVAGLTPPHWNFIRD